jgi:hypothetical protein
MSTAALAAPSQLTDAEMAKVVAGKKDQSTPGNGNDTQNDGSSNLVYEYINGSKTKYLDYDSGGGSTPQWTCNTYGTITNGIYTPITSCGF